MNRANLLSALLCLIVVLGVGFSNSAFSQCQTNVSCSASTDDNNPVCTTGSYDPCGNSVYWTFGFSRTYETSGNPVLRMRIIGASIDLSFEQDDFSPGGTYSFDSDGWVDVGTSSDHELYITLLNGYSGSFKDISATAEYRTSQQN